MGKLSHNYGSQLLEYTQLNQHIGPITSTNGPSPTLQLRKLKRRVTHYVNPVCL